MLQYEPHTPPFGHPSPEGISELRSREIPSIKRGGAQRRGVLRYGFSIS